MISRVSIPRSSSPASRGRNGSSSLFPVSVPRSRLDSRVRAARGGVIGAFAFEPALAFRRNHASVIIQARGARSRLDPPGSKASAIVPPDRWLHLCVFTSREKRNRVCGAAFPAVGREEICGFAGTLLRGLVLSAVLAGIRYLFTLRVTLSPPLGASRVGFNPTGFVAASQRDSAGPSANRQYSSIRWKRFRRDSGRLASAPISDSFLAR